jgi:hypothetical protein
MSGPRQDTGDGLEPLSELARRPVAGDAPAQPAAAAWGELQAALGRGRRRRRAGVAVLGASLAVAAALVGRGVGPRRAAETITYTLDGAPAAAGAYIAGAPVAGAELRFSDGTAVALERASRAWVESTSADGARIRLEEGRARFRVVHRPRARWAVDAGPFAVAVTGTTFDVRWSGADDTLEVRLAAGEVIVTGPLTGGGVTLRPGQRLEAHPASRALRIERADAPEAAPGAAVVPVPAPASPPPAVAPPPAAVPPPARPRPASSSAAVPEPGATWPQDVARGRFEAVLRQVDRMGVDACLRTVASNRLVAVADAARYAGRADLARRALLAQRERFPGSVAANEAAFVLGKLAEDSGEGRAAALDWYQRYLADAPSGTYAAEALGRAMLLLRALPDPVRARAAARDYLERHPAGPYVEQARQILGGAP